MRQTLVALTIVAAVASVAALGCGGEDESTAGTSTTLTPAQYVKQADAICARTETRQLARMKDFNKGTPGRATTLKLIRQAGLPPLHRQVEELGALEAPDGLEPQVTAFLVAFETGVEETEKDPATLIDSTPFAEAERLAKAAGLKVCGGA